MMNRILLFIIVLMCTCFTQAQESGTVVTTEKVYSESGFVLREGRFKIGKIKCFYKGLYTADGKVCVRIMPLSITNAYRCVAPGTEIIATGAFQSEDWVFLPKSCKTICTGALNTPYIAPYDESQVSDLEEKVIHDYIGAGESK